MVTFAGSRTIVAASIDVAAIVALTIGNEVVGVSHTELVGTHHRHSGASDAGRAVLFIDVTVDVAIAAHLHGDRIARGAFAFVVDGGHIIGVATHVVSQRTFGERSGINLVRVGFANLHAIAIDEVSTEGTVNHSVPVQHNLFVVEDSVIFGNEVLWDVEVGGEAPDRAAHASRASAVVELDVPEVVGVVPQVAHSVAVSQFSGEAAILRIHDRLRVVRIRMVGATKDQSPTSGVSGDVPAQGHATGFHFVFVVSRGRAKGKAFDSRARHRLGVDRHFEVRRG